MKHRGGTIYLRAKVGGKVILRTLKTSDLRIGNLSRDARLGKLRQEAGREPPELLRVAPLMNLTQTRRNSGSRQLRGAAGYIETADAIPSGAGGD